VLDLHLEANEFTIVLLPCNPRYLQARVGDIAAIHKRRHFGRYWPDPNSWNIGVVGIEIVIGANFRYPHCIPTMTN
jgi:hypothetical protein